MLIKTLLLFVLTFVISTSSLANLMRDIFVVETEAAHIVSIEVQAETEPKETEANYMLLALKVEADSIETEPAITVEETVEIEEMPTEETQAQEQAAEPIEDVATTEPDEELPTEETTAEAQEETVEDISDVKTSDPYEGLSYWERMHRCPLTARGGYIIDSPSGPNGNDGYETWYPLDVTGVVNIMRDLGYSEEEYPYWVREDGVRMFGEYVMVAGDIRGGTRTRGEIVETSLGTGMVCDQCLEAELHRPYQIDIATTWK